MEVAAGLKDGDDLSKLSPQDVQRALATSQAQLQEWLPGYPIVSLCLANRGFPKDPSLLATGGVDGQSYAFSAATGALRGLALSPRSPKFDPHRIPRVQATQAELDRFLKLANRPGAYYVSPGE
jgi:hypothetical protein